MLLFFMHIKRNNDPFCSHIVITLYENPLVAHFSLSTHILFVCALSHCAYIHFRTAKK